MKQEDEQGHTRTAQSETDSFFDQEKQLAALSSRPSYPWTRKNWALFAGLGLVLITAGLLFFFFMPHRPMPDRIAVEISSPSSTSAASLTMTVLDERNDPVMFTVTPLLLSNETIGTVEPDPSPLPIPSNTSTATATLIPAPSDTPSPMPVDTATLTPTATLQPPTQTPTQTGTPTWTPTMTPTPTPTLSYAAPQLLEPRSGQYFSGAETRIELRWAPVGSLRTDEWYGLIVRYRHGGQNIETGAWIKETSWVVPGYLAGQADEPERRYEWGIVVVKEVGERPDGSREGREISPRSEMWSLVWR